jgi:hypothetical protein
MKQKIKKYLKCALIGFVGLMLLGLVGSFFESWEKVPSYTPELFLVDVRRAEEFNATNHLPVDVESTDTMYKYTQGGGMSRRGSFQRPTLCSKGTLYQNNSSRMSIRCSKSFIKNYELADTAKQTFDYAIQSIESENWVRTGSLEDYNKNLDTMVANGTGTLSFKNDRISLTLRAKNKQECIKDNLNEFFCDETKPGVATFVSVTISADYSDF